MAQRGAWVAGCAAEVQAISSNTPVMVCGVITQGEHGGSIMIANPGPAHSSAATLERRVEGIDWVSILGGLDDVGIAPTGPVLSSTQCGELIGLYDDDRRFRSTIDMARHRFGRGQYRYFADPLPDIVDRLRSSLWPRLLPIAREWAARRDEHAPWPDDFEDWLERCRSAGQARPTPLLLRYGPGDWNALHRDLYGELVFPIQVVIGLDEPGVDYTGGEFVVVEQRPRAQSRATASTISRGHGIVLTTRDHPIRTARGWSKAPVRHSVSTVRAGRRHALGLIFHGAA